MGTIVFIKYHFVYYLFGLIHDLDVSLCICVQKRLIKTVHQLCLADTCLSKEGSGYETVCSGLYVCTTYKVEDLGHVLLELTGQK